MTSSPTNPFFAELAEAVEERLFFEGQILVVGITNDDPARERRYLETFADRRVDGIMLISSSLTGNLSYLGAQQIPVVVLDRVSEPGAVSTVHIDNARNAGDAVAHLKEHGYDRIACLAGPSSIPVAVERELGWRQEVGASADEAGLLERAPFDSQGGYEAMMRLMTGSQTRPRAVFISSDVQALGALRACAELGIDVPGDVALVSFDGTVLGMMAVPSLTTVRQPLKQIAQLAVDELLTRAKDASVSPSDHIVEGTLCLGESCGCEPSALSPSVTRGITS